MAANSEKKMAHKPKARANGEGTLFKRADGIWVGRIPNGYKPNGSVNYIQFTGKLQSDVKEKMDKAKSELRTNTYIEPNKITVKEWIQDTWLNVTIKEAIKVTTWQSYKCIIETHVIPEIGGMKLMQLQASNLQKLYNDRLNGGREDKKKVDGKMVKREGGLSPRTIRYMHTIIHSALDQAVKEKIIPVNVSEAVKLPKDPKKEMKTLNLDDISTFFAAAKSSRYYTAFFLELYTGLRKGELLGIRWKDVDLKGRKIKVVQQLLVEDGKHIIRELKTDKSQNRTISIPDEVIEELKQHKKEQEAELKTLGKNDIQIAEHFKLGLVFITEVGTFIQTRNFDRCFKAILKRAKLDKIRLHDLRHTFALLSLHSGTDIKTLQNDLGHESIQTTLDKYGHVNEEMKRDASNRRSLLMKSLTEKS